MADIDKIMQDVYIVENVKGDSDRIVGVYSTFERARDEVIDRGFEEHDPEQGCYIRVANRDSHNAVEYMLISKKGLDKPMEYDGGC